MKEINLELAIFCIISSFLACINGIINLEQDWILFATSLLSFCGWTLFYFKNR